MLSSVQSTVARPEVSLTRSSNAMTSELERIKGLEVRNDGQDRILTEVKDDMRSIRVDIQQINSKLSSITYDAAQSSKRLEETAAISHDLAKQVKAMLDRDKERDIATKFGLKVAGVLATFFTAFFTMYQMRYAIYEFVKKVFS